MSWTHLKMLMYFDDPLKRDFYIELCRLERWSSRQLQERMRSMLFERSALSRQPDEVIRHEVAHLRDAQQMTPDLVLKDPYILDFLGLNDLYLKRSTRTVGPVLHRVAYSPTGILPDRVRNPIGLASRKP